MAGGERRSGRSLVPDVLRAEPQFRLLFGGQVLSIMGDRVMLVALPFAVLEAGGGLGAVGLVVAAQLVPFLIFALVGGVLSDRGDRRRVLIASDAARLVVQATGGVLLVAGAATPVTLGALAALYGTAEAFFQPASHGLLPQTVSHPGQLQPANALRGLSFSVASIAGPALAGVLIAASGAGTAMLFDAASFAISVLFLSRLRPLVADLSVEEAPPPLLESLRGGWREIRTRRWIRAGLAAISCYHAFVLPAVFVLGPITVSRSLGGPGAWSAVVVAFGIGALLGDLLLLRIRPRRGLRAAAIGLVVASLQGRGLRVGHDARGHVRAAARRGGRRDELLDAVGGLAAGARARRRPVARQLVRLRRRGRADARRHGARGAGRRGCRRPGDAAGHEWAGRRVCARVPRRARCARCRARVRRRRWRRRVGSALGSALRRRPLTYFARIRAAENAGWRPRRVPGKLGRAATEKR